MTPLDEQSLRAEFPHRFESPRLHPSVFVAEGARLHGDITIGERSSIWFNAVLRADVGRITIGTASNVQDLCMIHMSHRRSHTIIGDNVTIGHGVILHGCRIGNHTLIGMGSQILDNAEIGDWVMVGAGSLVTENKKIPPRSKLFGRPARIVGEISDEELAYIKWSAEHYCKLAVSYR